MAAYTTGASWSFPQDLPGQWQSEDSTRPVDQTNTADTQSAPDDTSSTPKAQRKRTRTHWPPRQCRICLEVVEPTFHASTSPLPASLQPAPRVTYESPGDGGRLLSPCKCKGTQKYVHEECLSAWRRADPLQKRNYWQCPTCAYRYRLERLTWSSWISGTAAQLGLTLAVFLLAVFATGFIADPIINMYLDPIDTISTAGGSTGSLLYDGEPAGWGEHFVKGFAGLGLAGFAKWMMTLSPWQWFNIRSGGLTVGRSGMATGRGRAQQINVLFVLIGIATFLYAIWQGVRAFSRRTLESASERVLDVPGVDDDGDDEE